MEIVVQQCISRTHCIGIDKIGRTYVIEMPVGFYYLKGKKLIGDKIFIGDTRCLVNITTDDTLMKEYPPKQSEYVYA